MAQILSISSSFQIIVVVTIIIGTSNCQKLCRFRNSIEEPSESRWNFIESFTLPQMCFHMENFGHFPNSKVLLRECSSYGAKALREQKVYIVPSSLGGYQLQVDPGMGEKLCLAMKRGLLTSADCRSQSFEQTWKFKPVRGHPNQYLIEHYASHECLIPLTRRSGTTIGTNPCNSFETEQIWKVCSQA